MNGSTHITYRGFSWGQQPAIFADHWTTNDLKVTGHKSITKINFFLPEMVFCKKMVSLWNNDRFDNDKIFLQNIWHFSVITGISYVSICFHIFLKYTSKNFVVKYERYVICIVRCRVQYNMNVYRERYEHFEWKRMRVANSTNILNGKCVSRTLHRF